MVERHRTVVCPIIIGRDDLLELADRRLAEVVAGHGHLLFVAGEAGIGKTRLVGAIERRAQATGLRTVRAGTYPSDLQVAAAIFVDLARAMRRSEAFAPLGAALSQRLEDADAGAGDAHRRRRLLVLDGADLLAETAKDGPVLLILEDLHWSDDLTLEIIATLARRLPDLPLLVVGSYRSDELFPRVPMRDWRARLLTQRLAEEVRLRRLTTDETGMMVGLITDDGRAVPHDIVAAMHDRTDGIPLHVEEFLGVLEAGQLSLVDAIAAADAPDTVEGAIVARLAQRSDGAARLAEAGAVIGRSFDVDLLATVLDDDADHLAAPLTELADHHILLPAQTPGRLGFRHALICDAIYDHIPEPTRRRLHLRTAEAAAGRPDVGTDAFLSLHFERAGRRPEAFAAALAGARAATAISSHREARDLYERALRTLPADLDPAARAHLLEEYARSCAATDHNAEAAEAFEAAQGAYLAAGLRLDAAAVTAPLVAVRHLLGDGLEERSAMLRAALGGLDASPGLHQATIDPASDRVRGQLLAGLAAAYMLDRRLDEAIAYAIDAQRLARAADDGPTERNAATTLGACFVFAGRMEEGWALVEDAIALSRESGLEAEAARGYRMIGSSASVLVEYERGERWLREGIEYAERVELWNHRHYMAAHLGHVLWATGRWDEADAIARASLGDGRGGLTTRITALHVIGYVALGRGDYATAEATLREARDLGAQMHELQRLSPAVWGLAEAAWLSGDLATAAKLTRDGLDASAAVEDAAYLFPYVVTGTRIHLLAGDPLGARRWLAEVDPLLRRRGIPGTLPALAHAQGLILTADGATGQARAELEAAVAAWDQLGRVWEGTWATDRPGPLPPALEPADGGTARGTHRARGGTAPRFPGPHRGRRRDPRRSPPRRVRWRTLGATDRTRVRGRPAGRRRQHQRPDRGGTAGRAEDRVVARRAHPGQARRSAAEPRSPPGSPVGPCYTPALTAMTGKSSDGTAPERARDGASRAGTTA